jgi:branched-chain amino acid transport system substrate-binding protein
VGRDDIVAVFADLWERADGRGAVGCLGNDDLQGGLLRDKRCGFAPVTSPRGYTLVDLGAYPEPPDDFHTQVCRMREHGAGLVTSCQPTGPAPGSP